MVFHTGKPFPVRVKRLSTSAACVLEGSLPATSFSYLDHLLLNTCSYKGPVVTMLHPYELQIVWDRCQKGI